MTPRLFVVSCIALASVFATATAHAQVMPSPSDVAGIWDRKYEEGPCGFASSSDDVVIYSLQEAYERAGRCAEYGETYDRNGRKIVWINYETETPAPHTFQGFFAHYGLTWWDGYVPPRVRGTPYDSGTGDRSADLDAGPGRAACGGGAPDPLAVRLQGFLAANDMCPIYSDDRYARFKTDVPPDQHYAVNYVAWIAGEPLLPPEQASALDAQYLSDASLAPTAPALARSSVASGGSADAARADADTAQGAGACGFPVRTPEQAAGQDILASMNRCDEYTGPRG